MQKLKKFRPLFLTGITAMGTITILVWLPFKMDRQRHLDADLLVALDQGNVQGVGSLLNAGADPNARDLTGLPPESLRARILALFTRSHPPEIHRASALSYATDQRRHDRSVDAELVKLLLDHGADVKRSERCDAPPLVLAALSQDFTTVFLLLKHGGDPNVRSLDGSNALRYSIENGYAGMVQLLLDHGAQVDLRKDEMGNNDLDAAHRFAELTAKDAQYKDFHYDEIVKILTNASKMH